MRRLIVVGLLLGASVSAMAQRNRQAEISPEALKSMQTHEIAAPLDRVFPAMISVVTDKNYTVDSASRDAGLITATENTKSKMGGAGLTTKQNTIKLSITVVSSGEGITLVRINAVDNYVYTYLGKKYRDENQSVTSEAVYKELFTALDADVLSRR